MSLRRIAEILYRSYYVGDDEAAEVDQTTLDPTRLVDWPRILENERGRWDDIEGSDQFRVLYCGDSELAILVEVVATLRPRRDAFIEAASLDDDVNSNDLWLQARETALRAIMNRLAPRYTAKLTTNGSDMVYDVMRGASRRQIEESFALDRPLKLGDFTSGNNDLTRRVSRFIWETAGAVGIYVPSSEFGGGWVTAIYEAEPQSGRLRTLPGVEWIARSSSREDAVTAAVEYLAGE
jgi:RES domain